jgi:hypothetical protein
MEEGKPKMYQQHKLFSKRHTTLASKRHTTLLSDAGLFIFSSASRLVPVHHSCFFFLWLFMGCFQEYHQGSARIPIGSGVSFEDFAHIE